MQILRIAVECNALRKFVKDLSTLGFVINPYDPCVANRIVKGKQHTVCWHVDDIKSSHVEKQVQDDFKECLIQRYDTNENGNVIGKMKRCSGKRLDYLGMIFDFSNSSNMSHASL